MCLRSALSNPNLSLPKSAGGGGGASGWPTVHVSQVLRAPDKYVLIDVREPDELKNDLLPGAVNIGLGPLLNAAVLKKLKDKLPPFEGKTLVPYCQIGYRSGIVARELTSMGIACASLEGGMSAWKDPAAASYDFVGVLGRTDVDSVSMALNFALAAQLGGKNACVLLTSDAVKLAVPGTIADMKRGEPFKAVRDYVDEFLKAGGFLFGCRSCLAVRGLAPETMEKWLRLASAPDLVRWLETAKASVQYT